MTDLTFVLDALALEVDRIYLEHIKTTYLEPRPERVEPIRLAPAAPRIRVERCLAGGWDDQHDAPMYAPGWLVIYGDGGSDWCSHDHWDEAMTCALDRARARALGLLGRW